MTRHERMSHRLWVSHLYSGCRDESCTRPEVAGVAGPSMPLAGPLSTTSEKDPVATVTHLVRMSALTKTERIGLFQNVSIDQLGGLT